MTTFYYLGVHATTNQRTSGKIDAASEDLARVELNRMGLSVLGIGTTPFAAGDGTTRVFEFETVDQTGKTVTGTIEAEDAVAALARLQNEFHFDVEQLYPADMSDVEKATARAAGIAPVLAEKATRDSKAAEQKRMSLKGSFEDLVKRAEEKIKDGGDMGASASMPIGSTSTGGEQATPSTDGNRIYLIINELILPPAGKTRSAVVHELFAFIRSRIDIARSHKHTGVFDGAFSSDDVWEFFITLVGWMAATFLSFSLVATLASRYEWGAVSQFARSVVMHSTLIPYLGFALLIFFAACRASESFETQRGVRAGLLLSLTSVALVVIGFNVVY